MTRYSITRGLSRECGDIDVAQLEADWMQSCAHVERLARMIADNPGRAIEPVHENSNRMRPSADVVLLNFEVESMQQIGEIRRALDLGHI